MIQARTTHRTDDDAGGILNSFLVRTAVLLLVVGLLAFDVLSVGAARLAVEDQAAAAARAASDTWQLGHDPHAALASARAAAVEADPANVVDERTFTVTATGQVSLDVDRTADTFVLGRLAPHVRRLRDWIAVRAHGDAGGA